MKRINVSGKRPRKLSKTKWLCALGLLSGISLSNATYSSTASLHTFAEGRVGVYPNPYVESYLDIRGHQVDTDHAVVASHPATDLSRALFDVANDGTVVFAESDGAITAWSLLKNSEVQILGQAQGVQNPSISADGGTIMLPSGQVFVRNESPTSSLEFSPWIDSHLANSFISPDAQYFAGGVNVVNQRGISEFVFYPQIGERYSRFFASALGSMVYPVHFYEDVYPVKVDGSSSSFLMRFKNGYVDPNWVPGQGNQYENAANKDLIRMGRKGQYKAGLKNVRSAATYSRNGDHVLAYGPEQNCTSFDNRPARFCAYIWHFADSSATQIGGVLPYAMADDLSFVVGQVLPVYDGSTNNNIAVHWDSQHGIRYFKDAMLDYGIDMSAWSELMPINISPDGSKIVGHGLNPDGIRTGFLIDLPHKATEKWQTHDNVGSTVSYFGLWSDDNDGTAFGVSAKQSTEEGANIRFEFEGTRIRVLGTKGLDRGYYGIYIDGVYWGRYSAFECALANTTVLFESDYLGEGKHDILIEVEGSRDHASTGTSIGVDAFEVETYIAQPRPSYETGLVPAPAVTKYDHRFITKPVSGDATNHYNQTPPSSSCLACDTQRSSWAYNRASANQSFDSVVDMDGDFSVEAWVKYEPTKANIYSTAFDKSSLFEIAAEGKRLRVALQNDLVWLGDTQNVASPLNTNDLYDDHVVLTGNWQTGQVSLFVNNALVGSVEVVDDPAATQNVFAIGRPLGFNDDAHIDADFAKLSFYKEALDSTQVEELFTWPTKYGLDFAPYRSPEMSLWLPSCGLGGCEAGVALDYLPIYNGYGLSATGGVPVGGGTGGF